MKSGRVAAVTGAGGVLGAAMARALGAAGYAVAVVNRTASKAEAVADQIVGAGGEARAFSCDVLDRPDLEAVAEELRRWKGGIDVLVPAAGGNAPGATTGAERWSSGAPEGGQGFFDLDAAAVRQVLDLNFSGVLLSCQVLMPLLMGRTGATVITVSSMGAYQPMTKVPVYCAAKAGLNNLTSWLAVHFAPAGIRVNGLAPGFFSTEQNRTLLWTPEGAPTARTQKILDHTPMGRLGVPSDLEGPLLWLADSDRSGFVTGAVIPVDGGFLAYSGV